MENSDSDLHIRLYEVLKGDAVSIEEVRDLCFTMDIDWDSLGGDAKPGKARELVAVCRRSGRLTRLAETILRMRPDLKGRIGEVGLQPAGRFQKITEFNAARLQTLSGVPIGKDRVFDLALAPDGRLMALRCAGGEVRLYRIGETGALTLKSSFQAHPGEMKAMALSRVDPVLATGGLDDVIRLWSVPDGALLRPLNPSYHDTVNALAFSADGALLASADDRKTISLWRVANGERECQIAARNSVLDLAFSPDGRLLAAGLEEGATIWRVDNGAVVQTVKHGAGASGLEHKVAFSPEGALLVTASATNKAYVHEVATGTLKYEMRHGGRLLPEVRSASFSPDGALVASTGDDNQLRLWRAADGWLLAALRGHVGLRERVISGLGHEEIAFSPDGTLVAWLEMARMVTVWGVPA